MVNAPLTVNPKTMVPETVLFALDLAAEVAQPGIGDVNKRLVQNVLPDAHRTADLYIDLLLIYPSWSELDKAGCHKARRHKLRQRQGGNNKSASMR